MHECAPVKIDLLKGQQPLNLLPQEACSALQGDTTLRNMGWENMLYLSFSPQRQADYILPKDTKTYLHSDFLCHLYIIHESTFSGTVA